MRVVLGRQIRIDHGQLGLETVQLVLALRQLLLKDEHRAKYWTTNFLSIAKFIEKKKIINSESAEPSTMGAPGWK